MSKKRRNLAENVDQYTRQNTEGILYDDEENAAVFEALAGLSNQSQSPQNARGIIPTDNGFTYKGWQLTSVGIVAPDDIAHDDYEQIGEMLLRFNSSMQWLLGDWLMIGDHFQWGETYHRLAETFGYDPHTLKVYKNVCNRVKTYIRMYELSFGHHQAVAPLHEEEQRFWLERAVEGGWSISKLRKHIRESKSKQNDQAVEKITAQVEEKVKEVRAIVQLASQIYHDELRYADTGFPSTEERTRYFEKLKQLRALYDDQLREIESKLQQNQN